MWVWFLCSFLKLASLHCPPIMCIHVHNFHTCTPTTKVPISLIFRFPREVVVSETWNNEERNCAQLYSLKSWNDWVVPICPACSVFLLFLPFSKTWLTFLSFSFFPLYQVRSYILCLYSFEGHFMFVLFCFFNIYLFIYLVALGLSCGR